MLVATNKNYGELRITYDDNNARLKGETLYCLNDICRVLAMDLDTVCKMIDKHLIFRYSTDMTEDKEEVLTFTVGLGVKSLYDIIINTFRDNGFVIGRTKWLYRIDDYITWILWYSALTAKGLAQENEIHVRHIKDMDGENRKKYFDYLGLTIPARDHDAYYSGYKKALEDIRGFVFNANGHINDLMTCLTGKYIDTFMWSEGDVKIDEEGRVLPNLIEFLDSAEREDNDDQPKKEGVKVEEIKE